MVADEARSTEKNVGKDESVRPKSANVTVEEALRRMEEFSAQRKEGLIATVRKGKG